MSPSNVGTIGGSAKRVRTENVAVTNMDIVRGLARFVADKQFLFFAPVSRSWRARGGSGRRFACGLARGGVDWCSTTARAVNLDLLRWATKQGYPWTRSLSAAAAEGGNIAALEWLKENGCLPTEATCAGAALGGHLDALKWCRANESAGGGQLAVLRWLRQEGCQWDSNTPSSASKGGHLEALQYAIQNECRASDAVCSNAARPDEGLYVGSPGGEHVDVIKWGRENGGGCNSEAGYWAAVGGHVHVKEYFNTIGLSWGEESSLFPAVRRAQTELGCTAAKRSRLECVASWILANRAPARGDDVSVEERRAACLLLKNPSGEVGDGEDN
ncbi:unnamed protein product [Ectocarpus sp. CCAP 1310/34]|nr:unnamed protein product [Ectocarpus sp. CCAP 1310/34]